MDVGQARLEQMEAHWRLVAIAMEKNLLTCLGLSEIVLIMNCKILNLVQLLHLARNGQNNANCSSDIGELQQCMGDFSDLPRECRNAIGLPLFYVWGQAI